jgi:uncharacterized protein
MIQYPVKSSETNSSSLCKSCGLCCTGHLFTNAPLNPTEFKPALTLGLELVQLQTQKTAFRLPCPLWEGQCAIYTHPLKPSICGDFNCKLLQEVEEEKLQLDDGLAVVRRTKQMIQELDGHLHSRQSNNFRRRLFEYVNQLEKSASPTDADNVFRLKVGVLLVLFAQRFGVTGLFNQPEQEQSAQE